MTHLYLLLLGVGVEPPIDRLEGQLLLRRPFHRSVSRYEEVFALDRGAAVPRHACRIDRQHDLKDQDEDHHRGGDAQSTQYDVLHDQSQLPMNLTDSKPSSSVGSSRSFSMDMRMLVGMFFPGRPAMRARC